MINYAPLRFINESSNCEPGTEFTSRRNQIIEAGCESAKNMTVYEFIKFMLSSNFMDQHYNGRFHDMNDMFYASSPALMQQLGIKMSDIDSGKIDIISEWKDMYLAPCIVEEWSKNKQVYKPDRYFAEALMQTEHLELSRSLMQHLPYKTFYVDLEDCDQFPEIAGIFIHVDEVDGELRIAEYLLTDKLVFFSLYSGGQYDNHGIIAIDQGDVPERDYDICDEVLSEKNRDMSKTAASRKVVTAFGLQMLCYISSKEPDIKENDGTKLTYKSSSKVQNRYSEVQKWDVGIRYGSRVKKIIKEQIKCGKTKNTIKRKNLNERKIIRPYIRRAHWHHYWTGIGRTVYEVKWIEPIFVGGSEAADIVIHEVK